MKKTYWIDYWSKKATGLHKISTEDFLKKESEEKLFHLSEGKSILDFGCGSAELLVYFAHKYETCVGVDCSSSMIAEARKRIKSQNQDHKVRLFISNEANVWQLIKQEFSEGFRFDRITAGQVVQYLDKKQIESFILNSIQHLSDNGTICLFDIIDSRLYQLWKAGLFRSSHLSPGILLNLSRIYLKSLKNKMTNKPIYNDGFLYPPVYFNKLAEKYNLSVNFAQSMYYDRYHAIFSRN